MSDLINIQPYPTLQELNFPKSNYITLDLRKFNPDSATECFTAIQNAIIEKEVRR